MEKLNENHQKLETKYNLEVTNNLPLKPALENRINIHNKKVYNNALG